MFSVFFALDTPKFGIFQEALISDYPFFKEFFDRHKNVFGWHPSFSSQFVVIIVALSAVGIPLFMGTLLWFYSRQLKFVKNNLTQNNRNLQVMLFRALAAQMLVLFIVAIIPFEIMCFHFIFPTRNGNLIASICFSIVSWYPFFDIVVQFYFIKPYRKWITRKLERKRVVSIVSIVENVQ